MPEVSSVSSLSGYSVLSEGVGAVYGMNLINLKNWSDRKLSDQQIIAELQNKTEHIKDANIEFFTPPPVPGYGNSSGFELRLLDKTGKGSTADFQKMSDEFVKKLNERPEIENAFTTYNAKFPQYLLHIDGDKAAQNGVTAENAMSTLQTLIGSEYATNFIRFGQLYRVMVQSLPEFRSKPEDILQFTIKNESGTLIPFSAFLKIEKVYGPEQITRYNMFPSSMINGQPAKGYSSGQAIQAVKSVAAEFLPNSYGFDWAGSSRDQANSGGQTLIVFAISLIFVYLLLSAQYESFILPFPVLISLPAGVFGAYFFLWMLGLESNIYAQISLIMLIGILGKNAILIIEFAVLKQSQGMQAFDAVVEAATDRLRPILMTSFAFIAGLFPLLLSSGAGKIGNNTIGASSVGGMFLGTVFGVILIPGLFMVFSRKSKK
jgi:HAE1 family hydrophobic/amphiphilic exporter-1